MYLETQAGLLDLSLSFVAEVVVFILMIAILARFVFPRVVAMAEDRQRQVAAELESAEKSRRDAEERLNRAQAQLDEARADAREILAGANKSADQLRGELRSKAEEEAKRVTDSARTQIEAERQKAIDSVRSEVANLVVEATEKVVGETLDANRHRALIEKAIAEVGAADSKAGA